MARGAFAILFLATLALTALPGGLPAQPYSDHMGSGEMGLGMMGHGVSGPGGREEAPSGSASEVPEPGARIFADQCAMCHMLRAGAPSKAGPNLYGVFGRKAGSVPGYAYSRALKNSGIVWNSRMLDRLLADPRRFIPGTKMLFPGISHPAQRRAVIAYLKKAGGM